MNKDFLTLLNRQKNNNEDDKDIPVDLIWFIPFNINSAPLFKNVMGGMPFCKKESDYDV